MRNYLTDPRLRVVIVEDEAPARSKLNTQLAQVEGVEVVSECADAPQAIQDINSLKPDLVLLDIELGELSGFDVLKAIKHPCHVIFTTAYSQYAVKAFEKQALDYLLKPFDLPRLRHALKRVVLPEPQVAEPATVQLTAKVGDKIRMLNSFDIRFLKASQGLVVAQCLEREHHLDGSLECLLSQLPSSFLRVHRNSIVNTQHIHQIEKWQNGALLLRFEGVNDTITTSRRGAVALRKHLNL
ncbi:MULTISPECIES: LytR/AlgR family response regulator transcription factor [Idiomarina]|uniref:LytR/AlgR family response regulator transcription factor n=1 Tax=Idiomarina TaxID=135575 RepID=UPI000C0B4ABE|nr:LytTR family DNA-binding domain-containing protein [Idiomarina abyssalis]MAL83314.1 two-component system response regulator [Idiomarina sp.]